jgi:hypothetical protein
MSENEDAVRLAYRVLERVSSDPDDDIAILARQFLRTRESLFVAGDHLSNVLIDWLGADFATYWHPNLDPNVARVGIQHDWLYDVWCCWAAIMRLRDYRSKPQNHTVPEMGELCEGCPPVGYPTDKTRCTECPRRAAE